MIFVVLILFIVVIMCIGFISEYFLTKKGMALTLKETRTNAIFTGISYGIATVVFLLIILNI